MEVDWGQDEEGLDKDDGRGAADGSLEGGGGEVATDENGRGGCLPLLYPPLRLVSKNLELLLRKVLI